MQRKSFLYLLAILALLVSMLPVAAAAQAPTPPDKPINERNTDPKEGGVSPQAFGLLAAPAGDGAAPLAPPYCSPATQTFVNTTPVAIVDNTAVTSIITVSGAAPYLFDL